MTGHRHRRASKDEAGKGPASLAEPEISLPSARPLCIRVPIAARMLGVGLTKMYELIGAGEVETVKLGRVTLVTFASLEALVTRRSSRK